MDAEVPSEGDIVNTGVLMARWTNDEWRATAHRVIVSPELESSRHRYSIARSQENFPFDHFYKPDNCLADPGIVQGRTCEMKSGHQCMPGNPDSMGDTCHLGLDL